MVETLKLLPNNVLYVLPRGGTQFPRPINRLNSDSLESLAACALRWPEENAEAVAEISQSMQDNPQLTHWLANETAYFLDLPEANKSYALPAEERAQGYARFGADGLFHAWAARTHLQAKRLISLHLCADTTFAAIRAGKAVDSSSGYSRLEGLPGLTSCGDLDPSIVEMLSEGGTAQTEIADILYHQSGWNALAENISFSDLCSGHDTAYALPQAMYLHGLIKGIGSMLAVLGGADLIFCGCAVPAECENLFEKLRAHFSFTGIKFQLREARRELILADAFKSAH